MITNSAEYNIYLKHWKTFFDVGLVPSEVRPMIYRSWKRSKGYGLKPDKVPFQYLNSEELENRINRNIPLTEMLCSLLGSLKDELSGLSSVLFLTDVEGVVLQVCVDDQREKDHIPFLRSGLMLSEQVAGTNAVATAIERWEPVQIFGPEHYNKHFHSYSITAVPISDYDGKPIGTLSLAVQGDFDRKHILNLLFTMTKAIEKEMIVLNKTQQIDLLNDYLMFLSQLPDKGLILVNEQGLIVKVNNKASELVGVRISSLINSDITDHFTNFSIRSISKTTPQKTNIELMSRQNRERLRTTVEKIVKQIVLERGTLSQNSFTIGAILILEPVRINNEQEKKGSVRFTFADIIGENVNFRNSVYIAKRAAESDVKVLLQGESGTGKEVFAQSIHSMSSRCDGPFIAINCSAIPAGLVESEFFGYESGAYTGAKKEGQIGKFELAKGGTLFLDEIGELPLDMQAKFLRVLEENRIRRVGGNKLIELDVRIIASTNVDLLNAVKEKLFRDDLYYRLAVVVIHIPSLAERRDDLPHLIYYFIYRLSQKFNRNIEYVHPDVHKYLYNYSWPGNIRELENVMERMILLSEDERILPANLPLYIIDEAEAVMKHHYNRKGSEAIDLHDEVEHNDSLHKLVVKSEPDLLPFVNLRDLEKIAINQALKQSSYNISKAAQLMGIGRNTLYRKMKLYGIVMQE